MYVHVSQVILATHPSCDLGHSRTLLAEWANNPNNTIVFVERAQVGPFPFVLCMLQVRFRRSGCAGQFFAGFRRSRYGFAGRFGTFVDTVCAVVLRVWHLRPASLCYLTRAAHFRALLAMCSAKIVYGTTACCDLSYSHGCVLRVTHCRIYIVCLSEQGRP